MVDVGANHGIYSALAVQHHGSTVIAIEPNPALAQSFDLCQASSLKKSPSRKTQDVALLHVFWGTTYMSTLRDNDMEETKSLEVKVVRLDDLLTDTPTIDFLKIDVESLQHLSWPALQVYLRPGGFARP